uniref:Transmembrane protein n=1 Tax=Grammatophora oceanica TaxID=210454 RepID=A0A7S1VV13_9STRA
MSGNDALDAVPPLYLIGMEGFWGTFFCVTVLYPIAFFVPGDDHGSYENFENTWYMLMHTRSIQIMFGVYFVAIFGYNLFAVLVTFLMNSIWHAILDNFRPITVWIVDLTLFYLLAGAFGAPWDNRWSWLQLGGMIVLLYGTAIYNAPNAGSIPLKGTWYAFGMNFTNEYDTIRMEQHEAAMDAEFEARMIAKKRNNSSFMGERSPFLSKAASLAATRPAATNSSNGGTFV